MKKSPMKNMAYWKSKNGITPLKQDEVDVSDFIGGLKKMNELSKENLEQQKNIENPNKGT